MEVNAMKLFLLIFFSAIININCYKYRDCNSTSPLSKSNQLHYYLFCEYNSEAMPLKGKNNETIIDFRISPQYIEYDDRKNLLTFNTWLDLSWLDHLLTWEPQKWDDIRAIRVKSNDIWSPSLSVINNPFRLFHYNEKESDRLLQNANCLITYNGTVRCVTTIKPIVLCPNYYDEWPYDKHDCKYRIHSWKEGETRPRFRLDKDLIDMRSFRRDKTRLVQVRWYLNSTDKNDVILELEVNLQRNGSKLIMFYILPIVFLMILTLIVLRLDFQSLERILVACLNLICHILGLSNLHYYLPLQKSSNTPKILLLYEASVGLAAFALIFTCLLRKLRSLSISVPMWISSFTTFVKNNNPVTTYFGMIFNYKRESCVVNEAENNEETGSPANRIWQEFATILDWIIFTVVALTYVIVLGIILPENKPKDLPDSS